MSTIYSCQKKSGSGTASSPVLPMVYECRPKSVPTAQHIFGAEWDGTENSVWRRTDYSAKFLAPRAYNTNRTGASAFDNYYPWKGMQIVEDQDAGTLVSIPKYWYKWTRDGIKMKLQIADYAATGFLVSPAHADRGDGKGERDVVYVARYHCAATTYKSTSGELPQVRATRNTFRTNIHNLGTDIWQWDFAMYWTIAMLYLVEYSHWNSQGKIGYGCGTGTVGEDPNGGTDSLPYHTGAVGTGAYGPVEYRNIEGLWSAVHDWVDGIYFSGTSVYCIKNPANFSDSTGGTLVGTRAAVDKKIITAWTNPTVSGFEYALYPSEADADATDTYISDRVRYSSTGVALCVGGSYLKNSYSGLFFMNGVGTASNIGDAFGSRLMKLP